MSTRTSTPKYKCTSVRVRDTCGLFTDVRGLTVDDVRGFIYWIDVYTIIKRTSLDGSNTQTILRTGKLSVICKLNTLKHCITATNISSSYTASFESSGNN